MVNLGLKNYQKKGRPKLTRSLVDRGTPELQHKRQILMKSLHLNNTFHMDSGRNAVFDGCYLHRLFCQGVLNERQLQTGLAVRKLYHLCLRSQGIKNRLSASSAHWEGLKGKVADTFENARFEKKWFMLKKEVERFGDASFYSQLILKIILNDSLQENSCGITKFKRDFLQSLRRTLDNLNFM